jgi:hypothetical protein
MKGGAMSGKTLGVILFLVGVLILHAYQTLLFLWQLVGLPGADYPPRLLLVAMADAKAAGLVIGFSPFIGLLLMVVAGLIYGRHTRKEVVE